MDKKTRIELLALVGLGIVGYYVMKNSGSINTALSGLVAGSYTPPPEATPYLPLIQSSAATAGVPWQLMTAEIQQESNFDPRAFNPSGASGIAQFEPATAKSLNVDPWDPNSAIPGMASYLAQLHNAIGNAGYTPSWALTLAAYDWGIGNVLNALAEQLPYTSYPAETRNYVAVITRNSGIDTALGAQFA